MKPSDELEHAIIVLSARKPVRLEARIAELIRGGLPSQSFGAGVQTAAWVWPIDDMGFGQDREDRWLEKRRDQYREALHHIVSLAELMQKIEQEMLLSRLPFNVPEPLPVKCANQHCSDALENGLRSGECDKCRKARSRTGKAWQPKVHVNPKTGEMVG